MKVFVIKSLSAIIIMSLLFFFTACPPELNDKNKDLKSVTDDKASLTTDDITFDLTGDSIEGTRGNFEVIIAGESGTVITWSVSPDDGTITIDNDTGEVTVLRPNSEDKTIVITATITKGSEKATKKFTVVVLREGVYKINFFSNTGAGTMTSVNVAEEDTVSLSTNLFTKIGYDFAGWSLSAEGGVIYNDKQEVVMGIADIDLYAVWIVDDSLVVNYNFNSQSATDSSGNNNNGTALNITYTAEGTGYAAAFNGTSSMIKLPQSLLVDNPEFTIMMRFKVEPDKYGSLFGYQEVEITSDDEFVQHMPVLAIRSDGLLAGALWTDFDDLTVLSTTTVDDGNWHTVYFSAKTYSIALFLDGEKISEETGSIIDHLHMIYNQLGVSVSGREYQPTPDGVFQNIYYLEGLIDDFYLYSKAIH